MSVSHPLLKQLKGIIYDLRKKCNETEIKDNHPNLTSLCQTLEEIFSKGLKATTSTPFGYIKRDYWSWIYHMYEQKEHYSLPFALIDAIESTRNCKKVHTNIGRGRYFIRTSLTKQVFQALVELFVRDEVFVFSNYDPHTSILGNEILSEILSSLLHELNKIDFKLELKNASFLDETWAIGVYRKFEFVPCKEMGITFAYIKGRIVVVKVEEGSVAAEDNQIEPGDVLDELYGQSLYRCNRGLISTLANKYRGMPVYLSVVKACYNDGTIYPPLKHIIDKLCLRETLERIHNKSTDTAEEPVCESTSGSLTFNLLLLGRFQVKNDVRTAQDVEIGLMPTYFHTGGRAQHIELAINKALELKLPTKEVIMEITERDMKVFTRADHAELVNKHFSEISACGRKKACPEIFAFIFGNTTCTIADEFQCFVLEASSENVVGTILSSVAHGFVKTHWEV